jgi:G:T/U-mismatch repair DNA glycosylase
MCSPENTTGCVKKAKVREALTPEPPLDAITSGLNELYRTPGLVEVPLKLIIIGHNPSEQSWTKGHYYANPSNRMWYLLGKAGIVPDAFKAVDDRRCPSEHGIGFTDIMTGISGTHSCKFSDSTVQSHKYSLFKRLEAHVQRVQAGTGLPLSQCYPRVVAFAGVRQWKALFPAGAASPHRRAPAQQSSIRKHFQAADESVMPQEQDIAVKVEPGGDDHGETRDRAGVDHRSRPEVSSVGVGGTVYGIQTDRPPGWPEYLRDSVVFLLPSSSGAAALTNVQREGPYCALGELLRGPEYEWVPGSGLAQLEKESQSDGAAVKREGSEGSGLVDLVNVADVISPK